MAATIMSVVILAMSGLGLLIWLRSACRSVLQQGFEEDFSAGVAEANQLEYLSIRKALSDAPEEIADYAGLLTTLERDYEALTYMLRNAATVHVGHYSNAERLLIMDFQLLRLWVRLKRVLGWPSWRSGLLEMAAILNYFGNVVGQRLVTFPSRLPSL